MSQQTIAPITHVPFFVLYINGKPAMSYNGGQTAKEMATFLGQILSEFQTSRPFSETPLKIEKDIVSQKQTGYGIAYNLVCDNDKGVCYLSSEVAYKK
jgi:hypothetical protein